jgi:amino acid adenylation domain-containing protein
MDDSNTRIRPEPPSERRTAAVPLSNSQRQVWLSIQGGSASSCHVTARLRLRGKLDRPTLRAVLDRIVARHDVLRATFPSTAGEPAQVVGPTEIGFALIEQEVKNDHSVEQISQQEALDPFDLSNGPLARGRLLRVAHDEYVLLITQHRIVSDRSSIRLFVRELMTLYSAFALERPDPLPPLQSQYADHANWQQQVTADAHDRQLCFWPPVLSSASAATQLPTDRPRQSSRGCATDAVRWKLPTALAKRLQQLAQQHGVPLLVAVVSSWAALLSRWSGQDELVIWIRLPNRQRAETATLIGPFETMSALRIDLRQDPTVEQLLSETKARIEDAHAREDLRLEKVVEALDLPDLGSLTQTQVVLDEALLSNAVEWQLPRLKLIESSLGFSSTPFEVSLSVTHTPGGVIGSFEYARDLFERATIKRMAACWEVLLKGMVKHVRRPVGRLPMLSAAERGRVLYGFNETARACPTDRLVHELFEEQAECTPDAVAVVCEGQSLTYADLNGRANQLARYLRERGVSPDQRVALHVERSVEMMVGLLGILKAGGAYVPLDPEYPAERLAYMVEDATPVVLLTQERLAGKLPDTTAAVIALDGDWSEIAQQASSDLDPRQMGLRSDHLAYVIYTSGSTGRPKGVMIEHRNVLNLWHGLERLQGRANVAERIALNASFNFDASVQQFVQLLSGRTVFVIPRQARQDVSLLLKFIDEQRIQGIDCTPSQLKAWVSAGLLNGNGHGLRTVLVGGEAIDTELWLRLARSAVTDIYNVYGPTECTVDATAAHLNGDTGTPHIGQPMANRRVYIVDRHNQPVPIGVVGEIYIGGAGVGRGYLNRPELTAERFVADPFSTDAHTRMYKTGDLGRWRTDGTIEYLGRNDHQVKIRGFRIELGEIETQLARHAQVKEAVVIAHGEVARDARLVAYWVARDGSAVASLEELRAHLQAVLPDYMLPSAFVRLARLPLTPNGKLDRQALPAPDLSAYTSRPYEAPQGYAEEALARIWQELLRVERVGRHDSFFELGGHSLLIVQMLDRLHQVGLSADVHRVFESSSLSDLANALAAGSNAEYEMPPNLIPSRCEAITPQMLTLVELQAEHVQRIVDTVPGGASNVHDIYPLAPLQEGMLFHHLLDQRHGGTYVLAMLLSVSSGELLAKLIKALQFVINRHDGLRTAVLWDGLPRPLQVVYRQAALPVEYIVLDAHRDRDQQIQEWLEPARQRLDVRQAPLMRLEIAADPHSPRWYALLRTHHLVSDNESLEILVAEVAAHMEDRAYELPEPIPYRNHVAWVLAHPQRRDSEGYFRSKLAEVDEPTAPFGLLNVHGDGERICEARQSVEVELAQRVRSQARRMRVSTATLFHAVWGVLIARASARTDIVFGTVLLGRLQGNTDGRRILGMFINTLPLRLQLLSVTAEGLVKNVQRELVELVRLEQTSLAEAQRCSGIAGQAPLFSALMNYRHSRAAAVTEPSLVSGMRILALQDRTNYPIALSVDDSGDEFALTVKTDRGIDPHRVLSHVCTTIRSLVNALETAPLTPATTLSVLPEEEWDQVVRSFNATDAAYPEHTPLHELFEQQVQRAPQATAVVYEELALTFAQLNERANQLARCLRAHGVGPDQLVGICIERSLEMVIAMLGVWKAGGAYVPLDPDYPRERLEYMLQDAAPRVLLVQESLRQRLPPIAVSSEIIALDSQWVEISQHATNNLGSQPIGLRSQHLAYVIYTSGSTGQPKGVMVEHRNVASLWKGLERIYRQSAACERIGVNASFNFDASVKQLIQLLSGRTLILVPQRVRWDAALLLKFIDQHRIDGVDCTPSQLRAWIAAGLLDRNGHQLRVVLVGGEAIDPQLWSQLAQCAVTDFYNVYGPTESTVDTTVARLTGDTSGPHIGRPMENRRVYLLDGHHQPVPFGVTGEICIGGAGVARGYLRRPELTADRFICDPFSTDPQARLYKSGDLAQWRNDGTLAYLGRNDDQVKVRGFRIELGEIEAQLTTHEQVGMGAVIAREDAAGEPRLIAYVVPRNEQAPSSEALRQHLKAQLPDYMVPAVFVVLEAMPLTPSGKINRRDLAALPVMAETRDQYEPPRGEVEEVLACIWQELLGVQRVSRHDNFFDLGGHSLSAMQTIVRMRSALSVEVPISFLFGYPKLSDLATRVDGLLQEHLYEQLADADNEIEALFEELVAMPESKAGALVREITAGGKA